MAMKASGSTKGMKTVPGKGASNGPKTASVAYKPSLYFDGKQIPKELANAKPGDKVTMTVTAKVTRMGESLDMGKSISVELDKMKVDKPKG